jgi:hypothetical protein
VFLLPIFPQSLLYIVPRFAMIAVRGHAPPLPNLATTDGFCLFYPHNDNHMPIVPPALPDRAAHNE